MKKFLVGIGMLVVVCVVVVGAGNDALRIIKSSEASRSIGRPGAGRLENGKRLPSAGPNFRTYSRLGSLIGRTSVHGKVRAAVVEAYHRIHESSPDLRFVFGETGWPDGGAIRPHRTHQNGLSVDFMVPVRKRGEVSSLPTWPWRKFGYAIEFDDEGRAPGLEIDFNAMAVHLETLREAAHTHDLHIAVVIFAPDLQDELFQTRTGQRIRHLISFSERPAWVRHDEHYHVDFRLAEGGS